MPNTPSLVINTSPLVALTAALENFQIIGEAATLLVPGEVIAELDDSQGRDEAAKMVRAASWCEIRPAFSVLPPALQVSLGPGEAAVIHTALTEEISTVAIDERKGRRWAVLHGLQVTGSLGLLLALRRRGLVPPLEIAIARMKAKGIHLSDSLVAEVLRLEAIKK